MHTYILVIVRYSYLTQSWRDWRIAQHKSFKQYRAELFDPERLATHEGLFLNLTLPSLQAQNHLRAPREDVTFKVLIATSSELPEPFKQRLRDALSGHEWAVLHELEPAKRRFRDRAGDLVAAELTHGRDAACVTVSLDDDDALPVDYVERLLPYVRPDLVGFGLTFGSGYVLTFDSDGPRFAHIYRSMESAGLAYLNRWEAAAGRWTTPFSTVYEVSHNKLDRYVPTIVDSREPGYLMSYHFASDRVAKAGYPPVPKGTTPVSVEEVAERFEIGALAGLDPVHRIQVARAAAAQAAAGPERSGGSGGIVRRSLHRARRAPIVVRQRGLRQAALDATAKVRRRLARPPARR